MVIPKDFFKYITIWRKSKDEVTKCFANKQGGMENVIDVVSRVEIPMTRELLAVECTRNSMAPTEQLLNWNHLYEYCG